MITQRNINIIRPINKCFTKNIKIKENKKFIIKSVKHKIRKNLSFTRNDQIKKNYFQVYNDLIFKKMIKIKNILHKHDLKSDYRSKMIDWLIDVFNNFPNSSDYTYFKTVQIIDLYLFKTDKIIKNDDILKIGLSSIILATKIEDIIQIDLEDLIVEAGKNYYKIEEIKKLEFEIFQTLDYKLNDPTILTFFDNIIADNFDLNFIDTKLLANLKKNSVYLMKILWMNENIYEYQINNVVLAILIFCLKNLDNFKNSTELNTLKSNFLNNKWFNKKIVKLLYKKDIYKNMNKYLTNPKFNNIKNPRHLKYYLIDFKNFD